MVGEEAATAMAVAKDYNKVVVVEDEMGEGMQCSDHPYRTNPGGICAFCLQDKLGKLLTSSSSSLSSTSSSFFPAAVAPSSDGSSPAPAAPNSTSVTATNNGSQFYQHHRTTLPRGPRMPSFGFTTPKKKKKEAVDHSSRRRRHPQPVGLQRSKSTATPHRGGSGGGVFSGHPRKSGGGFWSFLYHAIPTSAARKVNHQPREKPGSLALGSDLPRRAESTGESESPNASSSSSSFGRKVSRSRSVGCGSRSFSGDFFERISTGFGDCTLRRVESQRDTKPRAASAVPERVRCGGIFSGFILTSASSYLVSTAAAPGREEVNGRSIAVSQTAPMTPASSSSMAHGRYRSWGWALASPMRAFGGGRPSSNSKEGRRDTVVNGNGSGSGTGDTNTNTNTNTTTNNATATTPNVACHSVSIGRAETMD